MKGDEAEKHIIEIELNKLMHSSGDAFTMPRQRHFPIKSFNMFFFFLSFIFLPRPVSVSYSTHLALSEIEA